MSDKYYIVAKCGEGFLEDRKSLFYSFMMPAKTKEEAMSLVESLKKKYYDASAHTYAYITDEGMSKKYNDDGEPAGTAGKPIMDVLEGAGLTDVICVVIRYFGGTLLGKGGLIHAFSGAAKDALLHTEVSEQFNASKLIYQFDYDFYGKLQHYTESRGIYIHNTEFTDSVKVEVLVKEDETESFIKKMIEMSNAKINLLDNIPIRYIISNGKPQIRG